jgi:hypothetical protein
MLYVELGIDKKEFEEVAKFVYFAVKLAPVVTLTIPASFVGL